MVSLYRLKGRALQVGNTAVVSLAFFTGTALITAVNFLPVIYRNIILPRLSFNKEVFLDLVNIFAALIFLFLSFSFYSSMRLGVKRYLFKKAQKKKATSVDIFFYFSPREAVSAFSVSLRITLIKLMIMLFCFLPSAVCFFTVVRFSAQGVSALVCLSLSVTAVLLFLNGSFFYSLFYSSFFLCDYYFIEGTFISFRHLVSCSQRDMRGKNSVLTRLKMSFAGWLVLCLLVFPIPYVWGYYNQSLAVAASEFMKEKGN